MTSMQHAAIIPLSLCLTIDLQQVAGSAQRTNSSAAVLACHNLPVPENAVEKALEAGIELSGGLVGRGP